MNINQVTLVGRLTKDPELSTIGEKNTTKAVLTLAINRVGQEKTDFVPIEVFGTQADNVGKYLIKGQEVGVTGSLRFDSWKKDNKWYNRAYVVADRVQFGSKPNGSFSGPTGSSEEETTEEIPF